MSNLTDFFPSGGGGGLTPKFQEFNSSGTFTPSQALIDAGGYIEVFLVASGGKGVNSGYGGNGGEVIMKKMYLTSVSSISVTIAAGTEVSGAGSNSSFNGSSAGGIDLLAAGGTGAYAYGQNNKISPSWGGFNGGNTASGNGVFGYGAGGQSTGGVNSAKVNSGQGVAVGTSGSGYCLIKWYE